jgi:filamentous hemagglutinin
MIQRLLFLAGVLVVILVGYPYLTPFVIAPQDGQVSAPASALLVPDVEIRDRDGRVAYRGDVDLAPELARIQRGDRDAHRNDGSVFQNREGRLPKRERGYYREYVVRTPGIDHAGPQRLVLGVGGEVYYSPDHYRSFERIQ